MSTKNDSVLGRTKNTHVFIIVGVLAGLSLLYAVFLAQPLLPLILVWTGVVLSIVLLYLLWRVVLAIETIADSMK